MLELFHDYETQSEADITDVGADAYFNHPSTEVQTVAYSFDRVNIEQWQRGDGRMPSEFLDALTDPHVIKKAFNSPFERGCAKTVLKLPVGTADWRCTQVLAYMQSFSGGLEDIVSQIGLPAQYQKMTEGKKLVRLFSMPQRLTKNQPHLWRNEKTNPVEWERYLDYNRQDVVAEIAIDQRLGRFPVLDEEWENFSIDLEINDTGMPVNLAFVRSALALAEERTKELLDQIGAITGLDNPNSRDQLLPWLRDRGYWFNDLRADTVEKVRNENKVNPLLSAEASTVLALREWSSRNSPKKYAKIIEWCVEGRARNMFQFAGASRTNREAGRGPQPQNLPRTPKWMEGRAKIKIIADLIEQRDRSGIELYAGELLDGVVGSARSSFQTDPDETFCVCDLSAIESRVIGWLTGCEKLNKVFADGRDPYIDFGVDFYHRDYALITKAERTKMKPAVLGCFAADTLVLTRRGWIAIVNVTVQDELFDGVEWVQHEGVVNQGDRDTINLSGVRVTPEHEILVGKEWRTAWDVKADMRLKAQAIGLANGALKSTNIARTGCTIHAFATDADRVSLSTRKVLNSAKADRVCRAPTHGFGQRRTAFIFGSAHRVAIQSTGLQTDIMRSYRAASRRGLLDTRFVALSAALRPSMSLSSTALHCQATTIQTSRLIGRTTTATTKRATSGLSRKRRITATKRSTSGSSTTARSMWPSISTSGSVHATATYQPFCGKFIEDLTRRRSSANRRIAGEHTVYDIVNCGPRHRFMVLTTSGPMIVHNCGYRLGGGDLQDGERTGLWGYAENNGVDLTQDEAADMVNLFREKYDEIVQFWYALEQDSCRCVRTREAQWSGAVRWEMLGPYLTAVLPSGRRMYYYLPEVRAEQRMSRRGKPYKKDSLSYMGKNQLTQQWTRLHSHGGLLIENLVQGIARDVLWLCIRRARDAGFRIAGHVHDEIIALLKKLGDWLTLADLRYLMKKPIAWAPGLLLDAAGYVNPIYMKD